MECRRVRDLPTGPALLALARDVLLNELMPLLPQEAHLEARLVANSMAIAEREAVAGEARRRRSSASWKSYTANAGSTRRGLLTRLARDCGAVHSKVPSRANTTRARYCGGSPSPSFAAPIRGS